MKLFLKVIFISVCLFLSSQTLAWTKDYVSAFKPVQKAKDLSEFQRNVKKDFFQFRSIMSVQEKEIIGLMKDNTNHTQNTQPTEI